MHIGTSAVHEIWTHYIEKLKITLFLNFEKFLFNICGLFINQTTLLYNSNIFSSVLL